MITIPEFSYFFCKLEIANCKFSRGTLSILESSARVTGSFLNNSIDSIFCSSMFDFNFVPTVLLHADNAALHKLEHGEKTHDHRDLVFMFEIFEIQFPGL